MNFMKYRYKIYNSNGANITVVYRFPWKVCVNNFLRLIQFWTKEKYICTTIVDSTIDHKGKITKEVVTGHTFAKVTHKYKLPSMFKTQLKRENTTAIPF